VNSYQAALYGMYKAGSYYLNGIAAYAFNEHRTTRDIAFDTVARSASANYDGQIISGYIEGGYKITTPYVDIIPLAAIQVSHLTRNGFSEDGAGTLDLTADKETIASYIGSIGARITRTYRTKSGSVTPEFRIRWDHEFSNDGYILNASLAGNPGRAFQAVSDRPDTDSVAAGLGLAWQITKNASAHMSYEGYFSKSATQHGGGMAGFRYEF
ncbi:MAG: autotransporter outer membrane beta-barrel domain-containing protein, partial [Syntrophorhabdus sp.]